MAGNVQEFTAANFEQAVLKSDKPVLVDFWAVWCGPCRQVAPVVEALAGKWGETVKVGKVNVDDHPSIAEKYNIMSIPTLMLFKNGAGRRARHRLRLPGRPRAEVPAVRRLSPVPRGPARERRARRVREHRGGVAPPRAGPGRTFRATGPPGPST